MIDIEKLKWTEAFLRNGALTKSEECPLTRKTITRPAKEPEIVANIVLNLRECPGCGYVFENASHHRVSDIVEFTHCWRQRPEKCEMKMSDIRTAYHVKRATMIALGKVTS